MMEGEASKNKANDTETNPKTAEGEAPEAPTKLHPEGAAKDEAREALQNEVLYLRAEFDNYKKRILREQDQSIKFGNEKLIREILSIVDLLDRGVMHGQGLVQKATAGHAEDLKSFLNGIEMTAKELSQLLTRFGVEFVGVVGEKFDPAKHEALTEIETDDPEKVGTVAQVAQRGCSLHGRLLAPAKVVVAKSKK